MALVTSFEDASEQSLARQFFENGYIVHKSENPEGLEALRHEIVGYVCEHLGIELPNDDAAFLNGLHEIVPIDKINPLRLHAFQRLNQQDWCRPTCFSMIRQAAAALLGNELAMQNKVNVSIQMPNDETSTLGVHSDVWAGETPFEMVQWTPLVDVHDTKAMFILSPEKNRTVREKLNALEDGGKDFDLWETYKDDFHHVPVKFGETLLFSPILLHGNVVNRVPENRWSLNTRFTGLFTPYASDEKCLGRFYLPITTKPFSRIGLNYKEPEGF